MVSAADCRWRLCVVEVRKVSLLRTFNMKLSRPHLCSRRAENLSGHEVQASFSERRRPNPLLRSKKPPHHLSPLNDADDVNPKPRLKYVPEEDYYFIFKNSRPQDADPLLPLKQLRIDPAKHDLPMQRAKSILTAVGVSKVNFSKACLPRASKKSVAFAFPVETNTANDKSADLSLPQAFPLTLTVDARSNTTCTDARPLVARGNLQKTNLNLETNLGHSNRCVRRTIEPALKEIGIPTKTFVRYPAKVPAGYKRRSLEKQRNRHGGKTQFSSHATSGQAGQNSKAEYLSALENARQALLRKLKVIQTSPEKYVARRRVMNLPALAAPCSEDFAITLRRVQRDKRFVTSPAVIEHVIRHDVPYKAGVQLLDAILRPPSALVT